MDPFYDVYEDGLEQLSLLKATSPTSLDFNNTKTEVVEIINDLSNALDVIKQSKSRALLGNGNDTFPDIDSFEINERERKLANLKNDFNTILKTSNLPPGYYSDNPFDDSNAINANLGGSGFNNNGSSSSIHASSGARAGTGTGTGIGTATTGQGQPVGGHARDEFYQQYQQQLIQQQDDLISNELSTSIQNLHNQALTIGNELDDQRDLLNEVDDHMDRLNFKVVNTGIKKLNKFMAENRRGGDCCIVVLVVILIVILVLLVIL
ncbi:unnamed protein product [Ambrosiozyma monospora]|uniref:Unnamed protein product n=1 Tax=Ambrosiozyma monospora TaxID=43982 RepID=A0A9W7DJ38_AMBMO|nr:unnamed protein product [Ambrosiozyma monospora]